MRGEAIRAAVLAGALSVASLGWATTAAAQQVPPEPLWPTSMLECNDLLTAYWRERNRTFETFQGCSAAQARARVRWTIPPVRPPQCGHTGTLYAACAPQMGQWCQLADEGLAAHRRCAERVQRYRRAAEAGREAEREGAPRRFPAVARPTESGEVGLVQEAVRVMDREGAAGVARHFISRKFPRVGRLLDARSMGLAIRDVLTANEWADQARARGGLVAEAGGHMMGPVPGLLFGMIGPAIGELHGGAVELWQGGLADFDRGDSHAAHSAAQFRAAAARLDASFAQQVRAAFNPGTALPQDPLLTSLLATLRQVTAWQAAEERRREAAYQRAATAAAAARQAEAARRAAEAERQRQADAAAAAASAAAAQQRRWTAERAERQRREATALADLRRREAAEEEARTAEIGSGPFLFPVPGLNFPIPGMGVPLPSYRAPGGVNSATDSLGPRRPSRRCPHGDCTIP